jgi:hypothetical protein
MPGLHERRDPLSDEDDAERQAASDGLGKRHEVGHDAELLKDEEVPRAPEAGLDLVEDERRAHAVGRLARSLHVFGRERHDPALAQDRFQKDRCRLGRDGALESGDVVGREEDRFAHERQERRPIALVSRQGERAHRAPVKTAFERDHPAPAGRRETRELDGGFDRLGAAVAEEDARHPGEVREALGEKALRRVEEEVRDVEELIRLLTERLHEARMAVAERVHGDAGEKVPVDLPVRVDELRALAGERVKGSALVCAEDVVGIALFDERRGFRRRLRQGGFLQCPRREPRRGHSVRR